MDEGRGSSRNSRERAPGSLDPPEPPLALHVGPLKKFSRRDLSPSSPSRRSRSPVTPPALGRGDWVALSELPALRSSGTAGIGSRPGGSPGLLVLWAIGPPSLIASVWSWAPRVLQCPFALLWGPGSLCMVVTLGREPGSAGVLGGLLLLLRRWACARVYTGPLSIPLRAFSWPSARLGSRDRERGRSPKIFPRERSLEAQRPESGSGRRSKNFRLHFLVSCGMSILAQIKKIPQW